MAKAKEGSTRLAVTIKGTTMARLEKEAEAQGFSMSNYVQAVFNEYFKSVDTMAQLEGIPGLLEQLKQIQQTQIELENRER